MVHEFMKKIESECHLKPDSCYLFLKYSFMANPLDSLQTLAQCFGTDMPCGHKEINVTLAEKNAWG